MATIATLTNMQIFFFVSYVWKRSISKEININHDSDDLKFLYHDQIVRLADFTFADNCSQHDFCEINGWNENRIFTVEK